MVATPGAGHLAQLKAFVYDRPNEHREHSEIQDADRGGFELAGVERVAFSVDLSSDVLRLRLLEMTPYWWSTTTQRRDHIAATPFEVDVDVLVTCYRRSG